MITDEARDQLVAVTENALVEVGNIRAAWVWLKDAVVPGASAGPRERILTAEQLEGMDARAFAERAYRVEALRQGRSALPPAPAASNLGAVDARAWIGAELSDLAGELSYTVVGVPLPPVPDPASRPHLVSCRTCRGGEFVPVPSSDPQWWPRWVPCPKGSPCRTCRSRGPCGCTIDDARVAQALDSIVVTFPQVRSIEQAGDALRVLRAANRRARACIGSDPAPRILVHVTCPVCHGRSLRLHAESPLQSEWLVECDERTCLCTGPESCGCGRTVMHRGARHRWLNARGGLEELDAVLDAVSGARLAEQLGRVAA